MGAETVLLAKVLPFGFRCYLRKAGYHSILYAFPDTLIRMESDP